MVLIHKRILHSIFRNIIIRLFPKRSVFLELITNNTILFELVKGKKSKKFLELKSMNFEQEFSLIHKNFFQNSTNITNDASHPAIIYLEFGVAGGNSIMYASKMNQNKKSRFIGFDSFEGLPENWRKNHKKGAFSTNGKIPETTDSRIKFVKGWFEDTLDVQISNIVKIISENPDSQLFINMDADIFSATLYVLIKLENIITKDVIIRFDEFGYLYDNNEFQAFKSFILAFNKDFEILLSDKWFRHVTLRII